MQLTDVVAHTPGIVSRMVDGEAVLVDPKKGMVRVLNPTGARIWEMIDGRRTVAELAAGIAAEYGIEASRAAGRHDRLLRGSGSPRRSDRQQVTDSGRGLYRVRRIGRRRPSPQNP